MYRRTEQGRTQNKGKVLIIILSIIAGLFVIVAGLCMYLFRNLNIQKLDKDDLGILAEIAEKNKDIGIKNIAVFGLDSRSKNERGRSDSIIIVSINSKENTIKMASILRDSYVHIEGYGNEKINHAYSYGGAPLAIKTLNQNFDMDIADYVSANFEQFETIIDLVGGVDINITSAERTQIPGLASGVSGYVHLSGAQALAYSRIRHLDSDRVRADRQKIVLEALLKEIKTVSPFKYANLIKAICSTVETSLNYQDLLSMANKISSLSSKVEQTSIPNEKDNAIGGIYEVYGLWVWRYDLNNASRRLHNFIYGD